MTPEQFISERKYLHNVSPRTVAWYSQGFKAFAGCDTREQIIKRIGELRDRGVAAISVNSYLRIINAYHMWLHKEHGKERLKIPRLKEEQKILNTFSSEQVKALLAYRPSGRNLRRAQVVASLILDTGLRISEALGLTEEKLDFDNLCIKVAGKGGKERLVPMSFELRKILWRYTKSTGDGKARRLVFGTKYNTRLTVRNFLRDFKQLGQKLAITGVRVSPHTLRHTFAVSYLRAGGNLFYLSKILGHTSVKTTERYLQSLGIEDLQKVHDGLSLLSR